jgi:hypothetical protein
MSSTDSESPLQGPQTTNLTVVADEVSIYEGGRLAAVAITELLNNEVAVRQLINDYNQTKRDNQELENEVQRLNVERAGLALQPALLGANAIFSIVGALLIGLGTNYVTSAQPPAGAWLILCLGGLIAVVSAIVPIALPMLIVRHTNKAKADAVSR